MAETKSYAEKLKDPRWQKKRLQVFERDQFRCQWCGDPEVSLHVHHIAYNPGDPWEISNDLLITLCESCHEHESENIKASFSELIYKMKAAGCLSVDVDYIASGFTDIKPTFFRDNNNADIIGHFLRSPDLFELARISYEHYIKTPAFLEQQKTDNLPF